jgi:hypothetical protein
MQKPPPEGRRKTVSGPSPGGARAEGEETSRSENGTRLAADGPPGQAVADLAAALGPGGLPWCRRLPGMASVYMQAFRRLTETTSSLDPTRMVKERGSRCRSA